METRFKPGEVIGKCTIEAFIAAGGMGSVYKAHQPLLNHTVALKVLNTEFSLQPDVLGRFVREGKLAARLDHPSIIRMYDAAEEDHNYFLIMEYVEGKSLSEIVKKSGSLPVRDVLRVARDVAEALEYAHSQGVVHRDIKPGNILVTKDGQAKIADFGIARSLETDSQLTRTGEIIGTPSYMSPEQCRGLAIDSRRRPHAEDAGSSESNDSEVEVTDPAELEKRVDAFSRTLSRGQTRTALRFVDPEWADKPSAEKNINSVLRAMKAMSAGGGQAQDPAPGTRQGTGRPLLSGGQELTVHGHPHRMGARQRGLVRVPQGVRVR
jgi:serine/threonine protein kinase